jgi:hypothetical protein
VVKRDDPQRGTSRKALGNRSARIALVARSTYVHPCAAFRNAEAILRSSHLNVHDLLALLTASLS